MNFKTFNRFLAMASVVVVATGCHHKDDVGPVTPPVVESAPNKVMGYISDINGSPIEGAVVKLASATATTDNTGYYEIENVTPGTYKISAEASGMMRLEESLTFSSSEYTQYYLWDAILYKQESVSVNYIVDKGGEAETTTETLPGNDKAEIEIDISIDPNDVSENSEIVITPIYHENSLLLTRMPESGSHMLVGCVVSSSNPDAKIEKPIDVYFSIDNTYAPAFEAKIYRNDAWVSTSGRIEGNNVVVPISDFGGVALFANVEVSGSSSPSNLIFTQDYWDNTGGARDMNIGNAIYEYKDGSEFKTEASNQMQALLKEFVARNSGMPSLSVKTGSYPINVALPFGTFLRIKGTQETTNMTVKCSNEAISYTHYGTCEFQVVTGTQEHSGGGD